MNYDNWKLATPETSEETDKCCESCNDPIGIMNESYVPELCETCYKLEN